MPPVEHRVELSLEPEAADRRPVHQLHPCVDPDVAPHPLQRLGHVLPHREPGLRDQGERQRRPVALADAIAVAVAPAGLFEQGAGTRRVEGITSHLVGERPADRLDRPMDDRGEAVEDRPDDQIAVDGMRQRAPDADVAERCDGTLVERHVLVRVPRHPVNRQPGNVLHLAVLVPWNQRGHVHLPTPELVHPRGRVGDEPEQQAPDRRQRVATPVVRDAFQQDVLSGPPLHHAVWPRA